MTHRLPFPSQASRPSAGGGAEWRPVLAGVVAALAALVLGVVAGATLTRIAIHRGFDPGATSLGEWSVALDTGTPDIDPYRRARLSRTAEVPMTIGQGIALTARRDDRGRPLDGRCSYRISGSVPKARFWTLTVTDADGLPIANAAARTAFTSAELLRNAAGEFDIALSPTVRSGNWLPIGGAGPIVVELRLYDTAVLTLGSRGLRGLAVPAVTPEPCP